MHPEPLRLQQPDHGLENRRLPRAGAAREDEQLLLEREADRLALLLGQGKPGLLLDPGQRLIHVDRRHRAGRPEEIVDPPRELGLGHVEPGEVHRAARRGERLDDHRLVGGQGGQGIRQESRRDLERLLRRMQQLPLRHIDVAFVGQLVQRVQDARGGAQRRIRGNPQLARDLVRRLEADPPDVPGQPVRVLADRGDGRLAVRS